MLAELADEIYAIPFEMDKEIRIIIATLEDCWSSARNAARFKP